MKKIFLLSALALLQLNVSAKDHKGAKKGPDNTKTVTEAPAVWNADPAHTRVRFSVTHLTISTVEGEFKKFTGTVKASKPDFTDAVINFSVDIASVNTDNEMRDNHLKSDDFFNAEKYPHMTFTSTSFKKVDGKNYILKGNLTIRDVTKPVTFKVVYGGTIKDPWGGTRAGFKATTVISRAAYNLKWNKLTEMGGAIVGDDVTINLDVEIVKQKA